MESFEGKSVIILTELFKMDYYQEGNTNVAGNGQENQGTAGIPGRDDDRKLFVGGLSRQTTDKELKEYFSQYGEVESVTLKVDLYTGQSRGFAFIVFANSKTIDKLLNAGDHYINKRKVDPKRIAKKTQQGKVFVGGLTPEISEQDIRIFFEKYGTIVEIQAPFDKVKNQRKGFCFITFESKDVVYELLKTPKQVINGKEVDVKKVRVNAENAVFGALRGVPNYRGQWSAPAHYYGAEYVGYGFDYDYTRDYYGTGYDRIVIPGGFVKSRGGVSQFQRPQPY